MRIPAPILIACAALVLLFFAFLFLMLRQAAQTNRALQKFRLAFRSISEPDRIAGLTGIQSEELNQLRKTFEYVANPMKTWWKRLEGRLVLHEDPGGRDGWYLSEPAREILTEESLAERYYHASFYQVVPGILTGLGLTATFVAILVALTGLHVTVVNETETVTGISELIDGLSGKFLSSIIGLLLSITFLLVERLWCERRLTDSYEDLVETAAHFLPSISTTRIELENQTLLARQSALLQDVQAQMNRFNGASVQSTSSRWNIDSLAADLDHFSDKLDRLDSAIEDGLSRLPQ